MAQDHPTGKLLPQSLLFKRYLILSCVGRGGMGAVYQALDTQAGQRVVAIKEMSQGRLSEAERAGAEARFQQEAALLGSLAHPNLPRFLDAFHEAGRAYLVMDFIQGKTLYHLLKEAGGRPLPVQQVLHYARQLCEVLRYLHQHQPPIIFRDLKPENIMVTGEEKVILIDFGIARLFKEGQRQDTVLLGSPGYAAPEQHGLSQTTPRSDLYSLGATLHHCLTGKDPASAQQRFSFALVRQFNAEVSPELAMLISRLVALDPSQRPASAAEVLQVLMQISQQQPAKTEAPASMLAATQYVPPLAGPARAQAPLEAATVPAAAQAVPSFLSPTVAVEHAPPPAAVPASARPVPARPVPARPAPAHLAPARPASARPAPASPIWDRGFALLFGGLLLGLVGGSTLAFNLVVASDHWVEAALALLLLPLSAAASLVLRKLWPALLLALTALAALLPAGAFLAQALSAPSSASLFTLLPGTTLAGNIPFALLNRLFTVGLGLLCVLALLWCLRPFQRIDRLALLLVFGLALAFTLAQYPFPDDSVSKHLLLVAALISVSQGVLLAARIEWLSR